MNADCSSHQMMYREREELKGFTRQRARVGDIDSLESTLIMVAHFMRQGQDVSFSEYAAHWVAARTPGSNLTATEAMRTQWPLSGIRRIADDQTDFRQCGFSSVRYGDPALLMALVADNPGATEKGLLNLGALWLMGSKYKCAVRSQLRQMSYQGWITSSPVVEDGRRVLSYSINVEWLKTEGLLK